MLRQCGLFFYRWIRSMLFGGVIHRLYIQLLPCCNKDFLHWYVVVVWILKLIAYLQLLLLSSIQIIVFHRTYTDHVK